MEERKKEQYIIGAGSSSCIINVAVTIITSIPIHATIWEASLTRTEHFIEVAYYRDLGQNRMVGTK